MVEKQLDNSMVIPGILWTLSFPHIEHRVPVIGNTFISLGWFNQPSLSSDAANVNGGFTWSPIRIAEINFGAVLEEQPCQSHISL
jgi:hypothetical protein